MKAYKEQCDKRCAEQAELNDQFVKDLHAYYGVDMADPFAQKMYQLAYESGHSAGHSEVANYFSDLVPLWELYVTKDAKVPS